MDEIPRESQQLLQHAQVYQQQMQGFLVQKESLKLQQMEIKKAVEEVEGSKSTDIYKLTGPLMIKTSKAEAQKELKEKLELIETRINTLEKKEKHIKEKIEELRERLTKGTGGGKAAG